MKKGIVGVKCALGPNGNKKLMDALKSGIQRSAVLVSRELIKKSTENIKKVSEEKLEPVVDFDEDKDLKDLRVTISVKGPKVQEIENKTHAFEYTRDDIPKYIKDLDIKKI
jgi:hypothetical protein